MNIVRARFARPAAAGPGSVLLVSVLLAGCAMWGPAEQQPIPSAVVGGTGAVECEEPESWDGIDAKPATFRIRQRAYAWKDRSQALCDYREERDWIDLRRAAGGHPAVGDAAPLLGLAFSGGGIRSASVSLGVLQALAEADRLSRFDYMSAVSGGGYLASWVQAHLGIPGDRWDEFHQEVVAENAKDLVASHGDHVEHLRTHAGFLNRGGWFEGMRLGGSYLWRWPCALVLDIGLHLKTRINNYCHPIDIYRKRLGHTYYRGTPEPGGDLPRREVPLVDANHDPKQTPYLVLNGNLTNWGGPRSGGRKPRLEPYNFEFTRHYTGSDGTGYVETPAFSRPVKDVIETDRIPTAVRVDPASEPEEHFGLVWGTAASGAAFDPDGFVTAIDSGIVRGVAAWLLAPLNLNVGYETTNFARRLDGVAGGALDYLRMMTIERLPFFVKTGSRTIKVTDGGHHEILGVAALARRGVECIVAVDATSDADFEYGTLHRLAERLKAYDLALEGDIPGGDETRADFTITDGDGELISRLRYVKSDARDGLQHMPAGDDRVARISAFRRRDEREYGPLSIGDPYPHTTTFRQWFYAEQLDAYRLLGYQLAATYLAGADPCAGP